MATPTRLMNGPQHIAVACRRCAGFKDALCIWRCIEFFVHDPRILVSLPLPVQAFPPQPGRKPLWRRRQAASRGLLKCLPCRKTRQAAARAAQDGAVLRTQRRHLSRERAAVGARHGARGALPAGREPQGELREAPREHAAPGRLASLAALSTSSSPVPLSSSA